MSWDGKIYDKYRIEHTDGTPLKGKRYFVLRLDSDDPIEAARVEAAMRAYKGKPRNCDVGTAEKQYQVWVHFCEEHLHNCHSCPYGCKTPVGCSFRWALMPYEEGGAE